MLKLDRAIQLCVHAHFSQKDKGGVNYCLHPIHVMLEMQRRGYNEDTLIVAVLHDAIEDSKGKVTFDTLKMECITDVQLEALIAITKKPSEKYLEEYIPRVKSNNIARSVKLFDLEHNMDITRFTYHNLEITENDKTRLQKYHNAYTILNDTQIKINQTEYTGSYQ